MQLHKIRQYSQPQLSNILLFKLLFKGKLLLRKAYVTIAEPKYGEVQGHKAVGITYERFVSSLSSYYKLLSGDGEVIIKEADLICSGHTNVFGHRYRFNPETDWLKDLETNKYWPRDVYWIEAKYKEEGLADVKYVLEVNKLNDVVVLANAYYISKDEKYIHAIEQYLSGWEDCVPLEKSVANRIVMDLGFRVINLIHVSLLCCDSTRFRSSVHPKLMGILKHHVAHLWKYLSSRWYKSGNDNNHNIGEIVGLYVGQIWLREFGIEVYLDKIGKELEYLKDVTERMVAPSGCYMEQSSNYTRVVHDFFLMFELFRHGLDNQRSFGWFDTSGYFDKLSNYLLDISYHGHLPNFGDNDYARVVIPFENCSDVVGYVKKYFHKTIEPSDYSSDGLWVYHSHDENDVCIYTRAGVFATFVEGAFAHSHNDLLAIGLFAKGRSVFIDKGTLYYNSGADIRKEFAATSAHNTVQIGDREMADFLPVGYSNYPKSSIVTSERNINSGKFVGEVNYKDIVHLREVSYNGKAIAIVDKITKTQSGKEKGVVRFMLGENVIVQVESNDTIGLKDRDGISLCTMCFEGVRTVEINNTDYAPHYGLRQHTHIIEASFDIETSKVVKTVIHL